MPILGVRTPPAPPPAPPAGLGQFLQIVLSRGEQRIVLSRRDGGPWSVRYANIEGLDLPATELLQQRAAGQHGSYIVGVDVKPREVFLPLRCTTDSLTQLLAERAVYNRITSPHTGTPTRVTVIRPDGSERWIEGYRDGEPPTMGPGSWEPWVAHQLFGLLLVCPDPWWRGQVTSYTWGTGGVPEPLLPDLLPVKLAPVQTIGAPVTVDVAGDTTSSPRWTLTGPFTGVTATHLDTGRSWTVTADVDEGEVVVVDTDPRVAATALPVVGPEGEDWFEMLQPPFDLWRLPTGPQRLQVTMTGSGSGTSVRVELPHMWETA